MSLACDVAKNRVEYGSFFESISMLLNCNIIKVIRGVHQTHPLNKTNPIQSNPTQPNLTSWVEILFWGLIWGEFFQPIWPNQPTIYTSLIYYHYFNFLAWLILVFWKLVLMNSKILNIILAYYVKCNNLLKILFK